MKKRFGDLTFEDVIIWVNARGDGVYKYYF